MSTIELSLAGGTASCPAVQDALSNKSHPCHKVVHEQTKLIDVEIKRQRPAALDWFKDRPELK